MIRVSQEIALKLHKEFGVPFGEDGIIAPHSHHKNHYYVTENEQNMRKILQFTSNNQAEKIIREIDAKRAENKKKYKKSVKKNADE